MSTLDSTAEQSTFIRWCIRAITIATVVATLINAWNLVRNPVWQQAYLLATILFGAVALLGLQRLVSGGQAALALERTYLLIFALILAAVPVVRGGHTFLSIITCVMILTTAPRGLGSARAERWFYGSVVVGLVASAFDVIELPTHMANPTTTEFLVLAVSASALLTGATLHGFGDYTVRVKLNLMFLAVSMAPLMISAVRTRGTADIASIRDAHLTAVAVAACASLAAFLFGRLLSRPLGVVVEAMERFAEGDHTARAGVNSNDEIGRLARRFNALAEQVGGLVGSLQDEVKEARRLGPYTLQGVLGRGGMGVVYRAHHALLRRPTAIKLLAGERTREEDLVRFEREVQLTARLTHPHTITIYDFGRTPGGLFYYAMELLEGGTIEDVVAVGGPQPPARVVHVMRMVAGALVEAHGIGLIHRDIKPANIMLCRHAGEDDFAKVLDFGLVKQIDDDRGAALSRDGQITGTPFYMAPESITRPDRVDGRADLYALGAVGYFMLTGRAVFEGNTTVEVLSHHLHSRPEPPSDRLGHALPTELERLILACLEKDPDRRPRSAEALRRQLAGCGVPAWEPEDTRAWWTRHEAAVRTRRAPIEEFAGAKTVEVDLSRTQR